MPDSEKNAAPESGFLYEDEVSYVVENGDLFLKKTEHFDERKIGAIDKKDLEEELYRYREKYDRLKDKVDAFVEGWKEITPERIEEAETAHETMREDLRGAEVIGDLEVLLQKTDQSLERLRQQQAMGGSRTGEQEEEVAAEEPGAAEPGAAEEPKEPGPVEGQNEEKEEGPETPGNTEQSEIRLYYSALADKAEQLGELNDWAYADMEFSNLEIKWSEGPDPEDTGIRHFRERIDRAREAFEKKKEEHFAEQKKLKAENHQRKLDLLEKLEKIVSGKEWTATREVGRIKNQWDQIKPLPSASVDELEARYGKLIGEFEAHKVDRLVKKKQKEEENLTGKLLVLDKMELLLSSLEKDAAADWKAAEAQLESLNRQWRKIGRVPPEKNQETWHRYHSIQNQFHQLRLGKDEPYRQQVEKNLAKKKQLVREAEALVDEEDLAFASSQVNKLHRRWKKTGNLPQKDENELWDRFKAGIDQFNEKKSANLDKLREQEAQNLEEKQRLIREAEGLKDSDEWEKTHQRYQELMKEWKKSGPVPKRQSGKIWKKFKTVMDEFYDRRRAHFKELKEGRKENLEEKQEILDKLKALGEHEDPVQAVSEAKVLQEEFKKAGYVPHKHKNRLWKEYREVCDIIYDRFRAAKSAAEIVGEEKAAVLSTDDITDIRKKQREADRLRKEVNRLHKEILQMKESLSYFKPSGKGSSLLDEVHNKISRTEEEMASKEEELDKIDREIDQLKNE